MSRLQPPCRGRPRSSCKRGTRAPRPTRAARAMPCHRRPPLPQGIPRMNAALLPRSRSNMARWRRYRAWSSASRRYCAEAWEGRSPPFRRHAQCSSPSLPRAGHRCRSALCMRSRLAHRQRSPRVPLWQRAWRSRFLHARAALRRSNPQARSRGCWHPKALQARMHARACSTETHHSLPSSLQEAPHLPAPLPRPRGRPPLARPRRSPPYRRPRRRRLLHTPIGPLAGREQLYPHSSSHLPSLRGRRRRSS